MQLKIDIEFIDSKESLLIDLLDNSGVQAWANHCKQLPTERSVSKQSVAPGSDRVGIPDSEWQQQQLVQQSLATTTLPLPMPVEQPDQITQQHLNVWHRWFTEHTKGIDPANPELAAEFHWLHELNQIVHRLEPSFNEWPKLEIGIIGQEFNFTPEIDEHGFGPSHIDIERQYHSWEHADLILDQAVHGKTTMQSFIDNDDPKNWDTTGHHISWGGCKLISGTYRQEIYQGDMFRRWMNRNDVTHQDLWGDYPLGNIVNRDQSQLDRIFNRCSGPVISVELAILD